MTFAWMADELPQNWTGTGEFTRYFVAEAHYNGGTLHKRAILPVHIL